MTGKSTEAASILWKHWQQQTRIDALPAECRPMDRAEGYAAQAEFVRLSGRKVVGWKIAATSAAGQKHIAVDGPLAGALQAGRVLDNGATVPLGDNIMRVAEAEFCFRFGTAHPKRQTAYSQEEVLEAVESLHPAVEVPDSRYHEFTRVGAPQLIADTACACWFVIGPAARADWRSRDLVAHTVKAWKNGAVAATGRGANVLGDPCVALTWLANELRTFSEGLQAGQVVPTGTCVVPVAIAPGDRVRIDLGEFGSVEACIS